MAGPSKPPSKRQRRAKAKAAQLEAELESSSSSGEESAAEAPVRSPSPPSCSRTQATPAAAEEAESSDSESSALLSSSDDEDERAKRRKAKGKQRAEPNEPIFEAPPPVVEPSAPVTVPVRPMPRQRSPSPPYFGFSSAPRTGKPILWGHVPGDGVTGRSKEEEKPEHRAFREVYLAKIVESLSNDIGGVQRDVSSQDKLDRLIAALADGADLFSPQDRAVAIEATKLQSDDAMKT